MAQKIKLFLNTAWVWFRSLPLFLQLVLVVPLVCAFAVVLFIGNMGLAVLGTAFAINAFIIGWISGFVALIVCAAGRILMRDRKGRR